MAAVDYYLKIDGIEGESQAKHHESQIDVESFSWGETNRASVDKGGGLGAGKVAVDDAHFEIKVCKASPKLMQCCATGEHIKKAVLTCRKAGTEQQPFLTYTFSDCMVSSYQVGGSGQGDVMPTDQFSLAFSKFEQEYKEQKADGSLAAGIHGGYDIKKVTKA